jgi:hypothetical protein
MLTQISSQQGLDDFINPLCMNPNSPGCSKAWSADSVKRMIDEVFY